MPQLEKHRLYSERLPGKDFSEKHHSNPIQVAKTAEKPQKNRESIFKSMIGGIKVH
jgi:hypothetical protein